MAGGEWLTYELGFPRRRKGVRHLFEQRICRVLAKFSCMQYACSIVLATMSGRGVEGGRELRREAANGNVGPTTHVWLTLLQETTVRALPIVATMMKPTQIS